MGDWPVFFARPMGALEELEVTPRLASWDVAGHPSQVRLAEFLNHAEWVLGPSLRGLSGPLALRLDVGLPATADLLDMHDLDNYAYPLATRIARQTGRQMSAVWCSKKHAETSTVGLAAAKPIDADALPGEWIEVHTTASATSTSYKQQIHDQLADRTPVADGPVTLHLSFAVGPSRNWLNLWKPTIDSLERILGRTSPNRNWHPQDGRIVELGLHCQTDPDLGNRVRIAIVPSRTGS